MADAPRALTDAEFEIAFTDYFDEYSGRINCPYCGQGVRDEDGQAQHSDDCLVERLRAQHEQYRATERAH